MKNWSTTTKWVVAIFVILILVAIYNWKAIANKLGLPGSIPPPGSKRSSNPAIQGFKNRAADISNRLTALIDGTNAKLKEAGSDGMILPNNSVSIPSGLCKCWSILWGAFGYYTKRCCDTGSRMSFNQKEDEILADFRSKSTLIESEGTKLGNDIDTTFPSSSTARQQNGCCCAWVVYYGIGFCIGRHLQTCCGE